jgi:threonine dehydratase
VEPNSSVAPPRLPTADEVVAARARIFPPAIRTPLKRFEVFLEGTRERREVYLKLETAQPIGSFKIRGASNAMAVASKEALKGGVWTASAGNMAQGVALAARERKIPCRVIVPDHAPKKKLDAIAGFGAEIVKVSFDAWWQAMLTHEHPEMTGLMIHPFADTNVMAGNGTIGLEIAEDAPDLDAVLVPWGGGGLSLGIAAALKHASPRTKVYAVEVETAAALSASMRAREPVTVQRTKTFIDGMGSDRISAEMWPLITGMLAGTIVVTVKEVADAVRLLVKTAGVTAEGAGAATLAAALGGRLNGIDTAKLDAKRVACIISGGNIDADVVATIMRGETP